jgi:transposase InsO family protein
MRTRRVHPDPIARSAFAGFCLPPDVIVLAVRWYLRFGLYYRDVEELLAERGVRVDHVTVYRWVQRFTPLLAEAARPCRHRVGDRWQVDETYVKVAGRWRYVYRAIDQFGQVIDVLVSARRDVKAVCQQPHRGQPRPSQGEAGSDARAQAEPQRQGRDRRPRLDPERSSRAYELAVEEPVTRRVAVAFDELALVI